MLIMLAVVLKVTNPGKNIQALDKPLNDFYLESYNDI